MNNLIRPYVYIHCTRCGKGLTTSYQTDNEYMVDTEHDCVPLIENYAIIDEEGYTSGRYWGMRFNSKINADDIYQQRRKEHMKKYGHDRCYYGIRNGLQDWRCTKKCTEKEE